MVDSYDVHVMSGKLAPLRDVLFEHMLRNTKANEFVVLNVLRALRVQLSSLKIIIGIL